MQTLCSASRMRHEVFWAQGAAAAAGGGRVGGGGGGGGGGEGGMGGTDEHRPVYNLLQRPRWLSRGRQCRLTTIGHEKQARLTPEEAFTSFKQVYSIYLK